MQKKILFLDGLRGVAAFYVMAGHARWLLWEGYTNGYAVHSQSYSLLDKALMYFFSIFKWGHEFVLFFFVLSGFVIHLQYARKLKQDASVKFNFFQYFFKRAKRIYPPFILAIVLTAILDFLGKANGFTIYSGATIYPLINSTISNSNHKWGTLLGNIVFLYNEYVPVFGTNGPTWSLKYEWWFYVLYPVFLLLSRKNILFSTVVICSLFTASFFPSFWVEPLLRDIFSSMICWWLGVLLAEIVTERMDIKLLHFAAASLLSSATIFFLHVNASVYDLQIALLFATILAVLLWWNEKGKSLFFLESLTLLGSFSYTLYIIHFPVLVFLSGIVMKYYDNVLPVHSFFIFLGIAICLGLAFLLHFLSEAPFVRSSNKKKSNENFANPQKTQFITNKLNEKNNELTNVKVE